MTDVVYRSFEPELEIRSAAKGGDGRTIEGIAVPYNRPQRIDRTLVEQFAAGAFNHQIRAGHRVPFARGHQVEGGVLIGKTVELRDDTAGLCGGWRVSKTPSGEETLELVRDGVLGQLSVGFLEDKNRRMPDGSIARTRAHLTEVAVVPEGAYGDHAAITGVRSVADADAATMTGFEQVRRILASSTSPYVLDVLVRSQSNLDNTPQGKKLFDYYVHDAEGSAWAKSPHPWSTLRDELLKNAKGQLSPHEAEGLASNIFHAKTGLWPAERKGMNPVGHG